MTMSPTQEGPTIRMAGISGGEGGKVPFPLGLHEGGDFPWQSSFSWINEFHRLGNHSVPPLFTLGLKLLRGSGGDHPPRRGLGQCPKVLFLTLFLTLSLILRPPSQ